MFEETIRDISLSSGNNQGFEIQDGRYSKVKQKG